MIRLKFKKGEYVGDYGVRFIKYSGKDIKNNRLAEFKCHCGEEFTGKISAVAADRRKSCGCLMGKGSIEAIQRQDPDPAPFNKLLTLNWLKMPDWNKPDQFELSL